ncbi:nucleotide pyrophosphohydrolase [Clostridium sp. D2Q-11]|uniref:Nucleotide pyrophosphohydrolase n=1 Tax=Anaeromonas frigoriresistens TaxID=2683708 RepID=A0A942US21_9FIRM|nr:nucleotide pyrophosphohydrolase [Anaeromonas frigoriresistens]MBS4538199.1 nucleotide pyrophosphohydrolase [Anaeromonas frigoriresistens]
MNINKLSLEAHLNAKNKGFHDMELRILRKMKEIFDEEEIAAVKDAFRSQRIALIASEVLESLQELRKDNYDNHLTELGDTVIRIGDYFGREDINLESVIEEKMEFNKTRDKLHGKRF